MTWNPGTPTYTRDLDSEARHRDLVTLLTLILAELQNLNRKTPA